MKLSKCDVCGAIKESTNKIIYEDGEVGGDVLVKMADGTWDNICRVEVDICRKCSLNILKQLKPHIPFVPYEKYNEE